VLEFLDKYALLLVPAVREYTTMSLLWLLLYLVVKNGKGTASC